MRSPLFGQNLFAASIQQELTNQHPAQLQSQLPQPNKIMYSVSLLALLGLATLARSTTAQEAFAPANEVSSEQQAPPAIIASDNDDEDDDGESLFTWGLTATVDGIDYDNILPEHEAFLEDALAFAFNKVHKDTDKAALSSHLVGKSLENDDDSADELSNRQLRRYCPGYTCGKVMHSSWRYNGSYSCRYCADDRLFALWASHPNVVEFSRMQERFERLFCRMLQTSDYAAVREAENCRFTMTHNNREILNPNFLAIAQTSAVVETN